MMITANNPNPPRVLGGIGAAVRRVDGPLKVTGGARYASDVGVTNPAYAYLHTSAVALGRITQIDESSARALPGVIEILTYQNAAGAFDPITLFNQGGIATTTIMPLQSPDIRHDGEIVAVIIAETYETARDASHRLRITYDTRTPTATFGEEGLVEEKAADGDPRHDDISVGNAEEALATAQVLVDQRYATPIQHHNPIELYTTTVQWEGNELTIYEPSQFVVGMQHGIAAQMRHDPAKTHFVSPYVGGGFGAKAGITPRTALVGLAARRLNRPVKLVATRDQGFTIATYRAETRHRVRLGASGDGRITCLIHEGEEITSRADKYSVAGTYISARMYAAPAIRTRVNVQHADRDTPGYMRAPAEVPYMFALESAMDELSYAVGIDPVALRRVNEPECDPVTGLPFSSRSLNDCYEAAATAFQWSSRDPRPASMTDGDWQVGMGCASAVYPTYISPSFVRVTLLPTSAQVEVAGHDLGTGAYTIYAQVAAEGLGLQVEQVAVRMGDSRLPPATAAVGSISATTICSAINMGCAQALERVATAAVADAEGAFFGRDAAALMLEGGTLRHPDGTAETLELALVRLGGAVEVLADNAPPGTKPGALAGVRAGRLSFLGGTLDPQFTKMAFGAEFVEVRVHRRTREVRVSRLVGAFASGRIINPLTARSQLLGGMIWGVSSALHEATEIDHRVARYTNDNLAEYLIPVNADIPQIEVIFVPEADPEVNALGIKGLGTLSNVGTDAAVCNAIYHATGVRIRDLPVRIEKLLP